MLCGARFLNQTNGWSYSTEKGFWVNNTDLGWYLQIIYDYLGDHFCLTDAEVTYEIDNFTKGGWATMFNTRPTKQYYSSGLSRVYTAKEDVIFGSNYTYNDYLGAPKAISVLMQTVTLPINAALWAGASGNTLHSYQWQSDAGGNWNNLDATTAVKRVTVSACEKLKSEWGDNLKIYLIKYRKQIQYKHPVTQKATNFDYDYLDYCASPRDTDSIYDETVTSSEDAQKNKYIYDITADDPSEAKENLDKALAAIAADIKEWAGYEKAKNVVN